MIDWLAIIGNEILIPELETNPIGIVIKIERANHKVNTDFLKSATTPWLIMNISEAQDHFLGVKNQKMLDYKGNQVLVEKRFRNYSANLELELISADYAAEIEKDRVPMALTGQLCQQVQSKYGFKIGNPAPAQNLSALEGDGIMRRFRFVIPAMLHNGTSRNIDWFDKFPIGENLTEN